MLDRHSFLLVIMSSESKLHKNFRLLLAISREAMLDKLSNLLSTDHTFLPVMINGNPYLTSNPFIPSRISPSRSPAAWAGPPMSTDSITAGEQDLTTNPKLPLSRTICRSLRRNTELDYRKKYITFYARSRLSHHEEECSTV